MRFKRVVKLSDNGKRFIKNAEGLRLSAYRCSAGKLTVGYGHRILPEEEALYLRMKPVITIAEADTLFEKDQQRFANALNEDLAKCGIKLTQNQFDALVAFIFNIGVGAWRGSTALRDLEDGKLVFIPREMQRWVHDDHGNVIDGLKRRRASEIALFNKVDAE